MKQGQRRHSPAVSGRRAQPGDLVVGQRIGPVSLDMPATVSATGRLSSARRTVVTPLVLAPDALGTCPVMMVTSTAEPFVPAVADLAALAEAARGCRGCELFEDATQTVFGAGSAGARVMFVGEQPGDLEDRAGAPFVGPAGQLLDRALAEAGIDRSAAYVTNAVKHFRFKSTANGQRRIHEKPAARHVSACEPWLAAELTAVGRRSWWRSERRRRRRCSGRRSG